MAVSDIAEGTLRLTEVESVPADASVRHVDQLSEDAFDQVIQLVDDDGPNTFQGLPAADLADGEIIVFTDYLRVELR
ncbi:hypothetical protein [Haloarchaeobius sp. HME9146]|uniref:hypothetical protein n=1 Tax=unclassified Haloarchaeobius TaxID=2614452 RepID=UPI0021C15A56|nr:hypothetical protein [Haloarchaeobius sp. HME9146]MCT9097691.1 hypothetical protein [Haloarchaeobius sp. HME9146]